MASTPKAFQTQNAAAETAAPLVRFWHQITEGLEAACRSSVGPAGRPAMLLSTSTASTEPMTVTKVCNVKGSINLSMGPYLKDVRTERGGKCPKRRREVVRDIMYQYQGGGPKKKCGRHLGMDGLYVYNSV